MKKRLALGLAVLLCLTCFGGLVTASAEAEDITPVLLLDGQNLNVRHGVSNCTGEYDYEKGYITLKATGLDPFYHLFSGNPISVGPYLSFKYRTSDPIEVGQIFAAKKEPACEYSSFKFEYQPDGEWHVLTFYLPDVLPETYTADGSADGEQLIGFDPATNRLGFLRLDFDDGSTGVEAMDIEYFAFFNTLEEAENYVHPLPEFDSGIGEDGSNKTYLFDSVFNAKSLFVMEQNWVDVDITEGGPGYVTFVSKGTDPYLQFLDPAVSVMGTQAAYIVAKYKTEADSHNPMQIEFYTNIEGVSEWGPETYASANLINDGEWHYVLVDATKTIGQHEGRLYSFRMDPLGAAEAGETIDMEMVKLFGDRETVWAFFETLAEEGDEVAQEFLDTHSFAEQPDVEEESSSAEADTEPVQNETEALPGEDATEAATTDVAEDTDADTEPATDADENTIENGEDTPPAAEAGCKGVITSAAVLGIVALAAGAVTFKKKD